MSEGTFERKKAGTSNFSHSSLVSPHTPTLANPVRGFGLATNNVIQAQTLESTNQETAQPAEESLLSQAIGQRSFSHDISRIALRRPQAKLTVGKPGDKYEQEADQMATQVMRMVVPDKFNTPSVQPGQNSLQRKCAACEEEEDKVQTKPSIQPSTDGGLQSGENIESRLNSSKGGGSPLADEVRSFMEPRFGADFSGVRVHTNSEAVQMNRELGAQAFTHGSDVYFGAGKSPGNHELMAHELTHVVQQTGGVQREPVSEQTVQLKCSACENEEAKVQRLPDLSAVSQPRIQRWSLFGDDEDKEESQSSSSESSSSGGILDWAKDKASGAVDTVTQAGGDAYDWAKDKASGALDTVTQAGGDAYDWAKDKASGALDTVTQAGGDAYDWAKETGEQYGSALLEQKKASLLAQISGAMQRISGQGFVSLTDNQIATLNGYCATVRAKSQGVINLPGIVAQVDPATAPGTNLVEASTVKALLLNMQSSISSPFMSPTQISETSDSEPVQGKIQRAAVMAPPLAGGAIGGPIGFVIGVIIMIILILVSAPLIAKKVEEEKEKQREKEEEEEEKKKKEEEEKKKKEEEELQRRIAECLSIHAAYKALGNCSSCKATDTSVERAAKVACLTAVIAGRKSYLNKKCDYVLPGSIARGSAVAEAGHQLQVAQLEKMLLKCSTLPTT